MQKKCPHCGSNRTKKKGKRNRKQRYMCYDCHVHWGGAKSIKNEVSLKDVYKKYAINRRSLDDLANDLSKGPHALRRGFDKLVVLTGEIVAPDHRVAAVLDATFFQEEMGYFWLEPKEVI